MNQFVDAFGRWIYPRDIEEGLIGLARSKRSCPVLDLRGVPLSRPPSMLPKINGLTDLYFDQNGLRALPKNIGDIEHLRLLSLGRNHISSLPDSIRDRWHTLQIIFLGDNQFTANPIDEEWMMMFKQGSVGRNPIPEPISPFWMTTQDASEFPSRIEMLLPDNASPTIAENFYLQALELVQNCPEPMIYEVLFQDVTVLDNGSIHWNAFFNTPARQDFGRQILAHLPRGSFVDPSLEETFLFNHS